MSKERQMQKVPVTIGRGNSVQLTPGHHSELVKAIVEEFGPRFVPGAEIIYVGDTGDKWSYFNEERLRALGIELDVHGKMPDVLLHCPEKSWLVLVEAVTSHGPMDSKRHRELAELFHHAAAGLVFVTAFPNRREMARHLSHISWETEVWVADSPTHLIHFNGERFLGPYEERQ